MDINRININNGFRLIEASAGTGKSFTLAHTVLRIIFENNLGLENILILSFTKNTCNELRIKIRERIDKLKEYIINKEIAINDETLISFYTKYSQNTNDVEILNKIDNFLKNINKINITTFHGFCNKLLDDYSIELSSLQGSIIENDIDDLYINIINDLWLEYYLRLDQKIIYAINKKKINTKYLNKKINKINKQLFINMLREIDRENICKLIIGRNLESSEVSNFLKNFLKKTWIDFCDSWQKDGKKLFEELVCFGKLIQKQGYKSQIYSSNPRNKYQQINNWISEINKNINITEFENLIYEISKEDLLTKYFYNKAINKEMNKYDIKINLSKYDDLQEKIHLLKDGFFNEYIRIFLEKAYLKLNKLKETKCLLNYNDLIKNIEYKYCFNNNNNSSIKDIQNQYKSILIDEFQDTDEIQWKIIKRLFKNENHFLLCVGDPKQAIYKFRGGDIETYLNAKNESSEIYNLTYNYRSSKELLKIINTLYEKGLKESKLNYLKLNAKATNYNKLTKKFNRPLEIINFSNNQENLEKYILNYLQNLLINNQDIDLNKIAILTSYNYQCDNLKNILSKYYPCKIINKNNIFNTEAASLIQVFMESLKNPYRLKSILILALSKFVNINYEVLDNLEENELIEDISCQVKLWSNDLRKKGFLNLVNELINKYYSPLIINNIELNNNLFQLSEIIENQLIIHNYDLNIVFDWYNNELNQDNPSSKGEIFNIKDYDLNKGINILTIHSSKGLEYDIVICPYLWDNSKIKKGSKGPIWKNNIDKKIYINIDDNFKDCNYYRLIENRDLANESERLIYVAITRAKAKLIIFNNTDDIDNILNRNILSDFKEIKKYLIKDKIELSNNSANKLNATNIKDRIFKSPWKNQIINQEKSPKTHIKENIISRSSYSAWINNDEHGENMKYTNKLLIENLSSKDNTEQIINYHCTKELTDPNPLSNFPKGSISGTCLHKIIERINFQSDDKEVLNKIIKEELETYDIDLAHTSDVENAITRILNTPLGESLSFKSLVDIPESSVLKEVKYDLPISIGGNIVKSEDIAECFKLDKDYYFGDDYSSKIKELKIASRGFHSGLIDCIIPIGNNLEESKWWIIDWKSNYISYTNENKSIPQNYSFKNLKEEMIRHHYPLQSHLYLLALHRLLKWRLEKYNPQKNLGGYIYIFIRGLPKINKNNISKYKDRIPGIFIGNAPIKRINYLDKLFKYGS